MLNQLLAWIDNKIQALRGTSTHVTKEKGIGLAEPELFVHQNQLLSNVSHELRTHMNGVVGMAELLQETNLSPQQREYVRTIRSAGDSLLHIVNDILDLSKIDAGTMSLERHPFDLKQCIEGAIDLVTADALAQNNEIYYQIAQDVPETILGDMIRLRQIVVNLLSNAVKFTKNGEVVLTVESKALEDHRHQFHFAIRDSGIGISPAKQEHLFHPFSQIEPLQSGNLSGVGLGLMVCKQIIELMEGAIWFESEAGQGTTFYFTIKANVGTSSAFQHRNTDRYLRDRTALIIAGHTTGQTILADYVQRWGMQAVTAGSASEALSLIQEDYPIDVVIADVSLTEVAGGRSGLQRLGDKLSLVQRTKSIPIVVIAPIYDHAKYLALAEQNGATSQSATAATVAEQPMSAKSVHMSKILPLAKPLKLWMLHELLVEYFDDELPVTEQAAVAESQAVKELSILLVEDNAVNQLVTLRILERLGYKADLARTGTEALHAAQHRHYELILMDIVLPDIDGVEVTHQLRTAPLEARNQRIIAMTAAAMPAELEKAIAAGMDGYITKPFYMNELKELLQQVELELVIEQ